MKLLLSISFFLCTSPFVFAQNILLFQNFEDTLALEDIIVALPNGNDATWIDADYDGLPDASGTSRPDEWFLSLGFADADATNTVMVSNSWTDDDLTPVTNYLILPPIYLNGENGMLHWKSAVRQTPRFLDGLQVLVSTSGNFAEEFTDTLSLYAEYTSGNAGVDTTFVTYQFSDGYVMGAQPEDYQYLEYHNDSSRFIGIMRPDSASLSAYTGQTVYIAFCHGSTNDNMLAIDDIKVTVGGAGTGCFAHYTTAFDASGNVFSLQIDSVTQQTAVSYLWNFGDGTFSNELFPSHEYADIGLYDVCLTITLANGSTCDYCHVIGIDSMGNVFTRTTSGFSIQVVPFGTLATKAIAMETQLGIKPNPASDVLHVSYDLPSPTSVKLNVYDLTGRLVKRVTESTQIEGHYYFDVLVADLPDGFYNAVLQTSKGISVQKFEVIK